MKRLFLLLFLCLSCDSFGQYFHYLHSYDTTADLGGGGLLRPDNSYLITGITMDYSNSQRDASWLAISPDGDQIIDKHRYGNSVAYYGSNYSGNSKAISNGGYILPFTAFHFSSDPDRFMNLATIIFLDAQLDTIAVRRYTDSSLYSEALRDCDILPDGSYILGGQQESSFISQQTVSKAMAMRVDAQGNLLWKKTYVKQSGKMSFILSVQPLDNNRTLLGGASSDLVPIGLSAYYRNKPWFIIIDNSNGSILRDTMYYTGYAHSGVIYKDQNGGYIHVGRKDSVVTQNYYDAVNFPFYIAHLDTNFKIEWLTTLPYSYQPYQKDPWRIRQLQNGEFMVCGTGIDDNNFVHGWVARFSNAGAILWSKYYYSQINKQAYLTDFVERPDGNIVLCGWTRNDTLPAWRGQELWLLGLYASGEVLTGTAFTGNASVRTMEFSIYPNPASGTFYLEVPEPGQAELYDMSGKQVTTYKVTKGKTQLTLDDKIPPGNYLLQFTGKESRMVAGKQLVIGSR